MGLTTLLTDHTTRLYGKRLARKALVEEADRTLLKSISSPPGFIFTDLPHECRIGGGLFCGAVHYLQTLN
jgi:hypothetical protein